MLTLPGYQISETLHTTSHSVIYRGQRESGQTPVILKVLNKAYPTPLEQARFQHEYRLTQQFGGSGIIRALDLLQHQHRPVMVLEDFGAVTLKRLLAERGLSLSEKLTIARQMTQALATLHGQGVMHKDLNPTNIVLNPATGELKLIDLGLATILSREQPEVRNPEQLEGTLAYLSPEQTGRMNRALDYRTDFYSLGVTLYEMLTGHLPFESQDPLELIHAHLARPPVPPHRLSPDIPEVLSEIVLKLLAKTAEQRYQSAHGLLADLEAVQRQWDAEGNVAPFPLGQQDLSPRFELPQQLYGREAELATLLAAFERVSEGATELLLVAGYAGVGKSALIHELHKPITRQRGYFISGKFDQFQRNVPYSALIQAFRALMHQLLTESEARVAAWRERLLAALGPNAQIIIDGIPELQLLIGPQPPVPELGPTENQNRFQIVLQNFIGVFAQPEHPLVLFLDDLQWADAASLRLLHLFLADPESRHLLVLGAYRDNEIEAGHPLLRLRQELDKAQVQVTVIALTPLDLDEVTRFVADTVRSEPERARPLAEVIFAKTQGNPFFLGEFLKTLYQEGLLTFVPPAQSHMQAGWQWALPQIKTRNITDNVVELMRAKLQQLPPETEEVLRVAALLGNQVEFALLAQVQGQPPTQIATALWPAIEAGLLIPRGTDYRLLQGSAPDSLGEMPDIAYRFLFLHDRVQQAAYELIPAPERPALHLRVGRLLLARHSGAALDEALFEIVDHLNAGRERLETPSEREALARLNLRAGERAKTAIAYEPATEYLQVGLTLLPGDAWRQHYALIRALYEAAAATALLRGDFDQMESLTQEAIEQARTPLDKVPFHILRIEAATTGNKLPKALDRTREALGELGLISLPARPTLAHVILAFLRTRLQLGWRRPEALATLPPMQDPEALATLRLLMAASVSAYLSMPKLFAIMLCQMVQLSLKHGNAPASAYGYAGYALLLCAQGDIRTGYAFGQLARTLVEQLQLKELRGAILFIVDDFVHHWKNHLRDSDFTGDYHACLEVGDLLFAGLGIVTQSTQLFLLGHPLPQVVAHMDEQALLLERYHQNLTRQSFLSFQQAASNLCEEVADPTHLTGRYSDEQQLFEHLAEEEAETGLCIAYNIKAMMSYHFGRYEEAAAQTEMAVKHVAGIAALPWSYPFYLYDSLARLAHYPSATPREQKRYLKQVAANQKKLAAWSKHTPMNCQHKYDLVEAERARLREDHAAAINHYQRAIEGARAQGYRQEEALANELAGRYYLARGMTHVAQGYLQDAHQGYLTWGAYNKVRWLEQQHGSLLAHPADPAPTVYDPHSLTTSRDSTSGSQQLDLATVVKASQAISSEIDLDKLLATLLRIVMENAGAEKGALLLVEQGELRVEAEGRVTPPEVRLLQSQPLEESTHLSPAVVHYIERTQQDVVLDDATQSDLFRHDTYIRRQRPRSILATPLLNQGALIGTLYLENNLTSGAFTPARVEMVRLLGTQAAISITNAQAIAARAQQARLHLEKQLLEQRAQDLAELNASKDKFFSIISHDLRSPFNALLGLSHLMRNYAPTLTQQEVENYAGRIYGSGQRVLALLDNLLQWAQMQTGRLTFAPEPLALRDLVQHTLVVLEETARSKEIQLLNEVAPDTQVYADANMLETVIRNLLSNALKFTHAGGQIRIRALPRDEMIEVAVADTGVGMSEQVRQKLFRIDVTHTTKGTAQEQGTGLGLILCKDLVERQGGSIRVESTPGEGTTFSFTVPTETAPAPPPA